MAKATKASQESTYNASPVTLTLTSDEAIALRTMLGQMRVEPNGFALHTDHIYTALGEAGVGHINQPVFSPESPKVLSYISEPGYHLHPKFRE